MLPLSHQQAIQRVADELNVVIGICPVNETALSFIEAGYPAKPFVVKNKTCDIGFAAGLIPIKPEYSQAEEKDYQTYSQQLSSAFEKDKDLKITSCILSKNRLSELSQIFGEAIQMEFSADENQCRLSFIKHGKKVDVTAKKQGEDYTIYDADGNEVKVLAKEIMNSHGEKIVKPITSDYDLLVVCPAYDDLDVNGKDKTPFSTQGSQSQIQMLLRASGSPFYHPPKEDPKMGNVSNRVREVVSAINAEIAKADPKRLGVNLEPVQHNSVWSNPDAREIKYPVRIFSPNKANYVVENQQELKQKISKIEQENYHWPLHAKLDQKVFDDKIEREYLRY